MEWNDATHSVYITSPTPPEVEEVKEETTEDTFDENDPFADTLTFKNITGTTAQQMYDNKEAFILFYYDSTNYYSKEYVKTVKAVAEKNRFRIYAVDASKEPGYDSYSTKYTPIQFIWKYVNPGNTVEPLVFFVYGQDDVTVNKQPVSETTLDAQFKEFIYKLENPTTTTTTSKDDLVRPISRSTSQTMFDKGEKFIYVEYYSGDPESDEIMSMIELASYQTNTPIYICDAKGLKTDTNWWGYSSGTQYYPTVYFVNNKHYSKMVQPDDINELKDEMTTFMKTGSSTISSDDLITEISRSTSQTMFDKGEKFIYVEYYSGDSDSDEIMPMIELSAYKTNTPIYISDVSKSSSYSTYWWGYPDESSDYPIIYFVEDGHYTTSVQPSDAASIERRMMSFMD